MNVINIRQAVAGDAAVIAKAVAMAMGEECAVHLCGKDYLEVLEKTASADNTQYSYRNALVAEVDGTVAGAAVGYDGASLKSLRNGTLSVISEHFSDFVVPEDETSSGEFYIDSIGVLPLYRGCGIGGNLLKAIVGMAFSFGHTCAGLLVDVENTRAAALYRRNGFLPAGEKLFFGHKMHHLQCTHSSTIEKILYTGLNYPQVKDFCGDSLLAPYFCMGFSMLSLLTPDGYISVQEGDTICKDWSGKFWVEG